MNKLKLGDWMIVAGGAMVLVFGLLRWFSWKVSVEEVVATRGKSNAFDYLFTGVVPWLLVVAAAVVTILLAVDALRPGNIPWPAVMLAATVLGFVLILVRLIIGHDVDTAGDVDVDVSRGVGVWLSALGALVAAVGGFLGFRDMGVEVENKLGGGTPRPDREIPPPTT